MAAGGCWRKGHYRYLPDRRRHNAQTRSGSEVKSGFAESDWNTAARLPSSLHDPAERQQYKTANGLGLSGHFQPHAEPCGCLGHTFSGIPLIRIGQFDVHSWNRCHCVG